MFAATFSAKGLENSAESNFHQRSASESKDEPVLTIPKQAQITEDAELNPS